MNSRGKHTGHHPFLRERARKPGNLNAALPHSVAGRARNLRATNGRCFGDQGADGVASAPALADAHYNHGRSFCLGNGGASRDAPHVAVEAAGAVTAGDPAPTATKPVTDPAMISPLGNHQGFERVDPCQQLTHRRKRDTLTGISIGGNGGRMRAFGTLEQLRFVLSAVVHRIEQCHIAACGMLRRLMHRLIADEPSFAARNGSVR